jgi:hypothetical protein
MRLPERLAVGPLSINSDLKHLLRLLQAFTPRDTGELAH